MSSGDMLLSLDCSSVSQQTEGYVSCLLYPLGPSCSFTDIRAPEQNKGKWQEDRVLSLSRPSNSSGGSICCSAGERRFAASQIPCSETPTLPASPPISKGGVKQKWWGEATSKKERELGGQGIRQECRWARKKGSIDRREGLSEEYLYPQRPLAETGVREVQRKME